MNLEIISFKLCPFVQSSVITLLHQGIDYRVTFIDISDPPPWFDELSPTGQVPILRVNDDTVIFESAAINEYLNDIGPCQMMPAEPLRAALHRAWTQFCGAILGDLFQLTSAQSAAEFEDIEYDVLEKLDKLEAVKSEADYFDSDNMMLIDARYAAMFMRLDILKPGHDILDEQRFPKLCAWSRHLLAQESVQRSAVSDLREMYINMIKQRAGFIAQNF